MTNEKPLSKEKRDELEQAAKEIEAKKEREKRREKRSNTKYGDRLNDE